MKNALGEHPVQCLAEFIKVVRLHHHTAETVFGEVVHYRAVGISTGNDGFYARVDVKQVLNGFLPPMPPRTVRSRMTASNGKSDCIAFR